MSQRVARHVKFGVYFESGWGRVMLPPFSPEGHLPVGRYSCTPEEAKRLLVDDVAFEGSPTRPDLWTSLERYLAVFFSLEDRYEKLLPGPIVERVWLGGSFVSAKVDPRNVDATLLVNLDAKNAIKGRPGTGIFTKSRDWALSEFNVSPLFLNYQPVVNVFRLDELEDAERSYLATRGAWDDWWQRTRGDGDKTAPTLETCEPRRGYLEVIL